MSAMNITIGQYYPVDSFIHRLDPRIKLFSLFVFIIGVFFTENIYGYLFSAVFLGIIIRASKVPFVLIIRGLKSIIFIIAFTVLLNMFFIDGGKVLFKFGFIQLTSSGIWLSAQMAFRLGFLTMASSVLTLTASPIELTYAIESILKPFKRIGVPAHDIAMMMTIAIRFIPTLIEEVDKIKKAQMARGAEFDAGGIVKKAKAFIPILVPLFVSAFRRADELAMAMEARCYRGDAGRTSMKRLILKRSDYAVVIVMVLFVIGIYIL